MTLPALQPYLEIALVSSLASAVIVLAFIIVWLWVTS